MKRNLVALTVGIALAYAGQWGLAHDDTMGVGLFIIWGLPGAYIATMLGLEPSAWLKGLVERGDPSKTTLVFEFVFNFAIYFALSTWFLNKVRQRKTNTKETS